MNPEQIIQIIAMGEGYQAEFKRSVPSKAREIAEEICAFANAAGGLVIIGVEDDNTVVGVVVDNRQLSAIQDAINSITPALRCTIDKVTLSEGEVLVIDAPSGKSKPYVYGGSIYVRIGPNSQKLNSAEEMREFFQKSDRIFFDEGECSKFLPEKHLDKEIFQLFRLESGLSPLASDQQVFENLRLISETGFFKNGAVLFFGSQPEEFFDKAYLRCVQFEGQDKRIILDDKIWYGPLYRQFQSALAWLKSRLNVRYDIEGQGSGPRKEIWEIPETVFKETLVNALAHRDYYERGAVITVELFDHRIEISNPGGLVSAISDEEFGRKSFSRNPLVFGLFNRMKMVEQIGSGIPRVRDMMHESGLPEPEFRYDGMFTVIAKRSLSWATVRKNFHGTLSELQIAILDLIHVQPTTTIRELHDKLGVSTTAIENNIRSLKQKNILQRSGGLKKGAWIINNRLGKELGKE